MILYLDLDGVIVDFDGCVEKMVGHPKASRDEVRHCMRKPGFFRNLKPLPGALAAVAELEALIPGRIRILSAVPHSDPDLADVARADKLAWLREYLPSLESNAEIVSDKGTIGTPEDYLLDDNILWNGTPNFPGTVVEFKGPQDWITMITIIKKSLTKRCSMVKTSKILMKKKYA